MPQSMDKSPNLAAPSPGYETRDANIRGVYKFLVFLSVLLVVSAFLCWGLFRYLSKHNPDNVTVSPFAETRQLPLGPQLQVNPREDWLKYYQQQVQSLETYSWENRSAGVVRVPVERAMDLLLQKGLPVQNSDTSQDQTKNPAPTVGKKP